MHKSLRTLAICLLWLVHFGIAVNGNANADEDQDSVTNTTQLPLIYPQPRIVGGSSASEGQFPHQVLVRIGNNGICGGSILSPNYVVTAAHCVTSGFPAKPISASSLSIRAGSLLINSGGQIVGVSQVKVHPSYRRTDNDIAVLKLSKPLQFNDRVNAIALARQAPATGQPVITSGWGRLRHGGPTSQMLQYTTVMAVTNADCKRVVLSLPSSVLCLTHRLGNGVCNGDSGGPAVYKNQLVGVTNFYVGRCASRFPDGYASVPYHYSWLKSNAEL